MAGLFKFIGRFIVHIFIELILELLIKGPGYLIIKLFSKNNGEEPTENKLIIVGLIFWCSIGSAIFLVFKYAI